MRENEFERKVQEQLEELRIRPSDETWERVQKELREKKKRRAAVLFFFLAGLLLLGYSGYTFLFNSSTTPVAKNAAEQQITEPGNTQTPDNTITTNTAVAEKPVTTPTIDQTDKRNAVNPVLTLDIEKDNSVVVKPANSEKPNQPGNKITGKETITKKAERQQTKNLIGARKTNSKVIPDGPKNNIAVNPFAQINNQQAQQQAEKKQDIAKNDVRDSSTTTYTAVAKTPVEQTDLPETVEPKPAIVKNKNNSKIKFGVEISGGFVSSSDKPFGIGFDIFSQEKSLDQNPPGYSGGVTNNPGQGGSTGRVIIPPSDIKPGQGWKLGLTAEKAITKRSSISAGIRYVYLDESLEVGSVRDTVIRSNSYSFAQNTFLDRGLRGAYSNAAAPPAARAKYTNRYHFLELPVSFQTRLNKGNKVGILWNAGIVPGYLIGTNAIVYDSTAGGIYFKDDRAFKRFHFNVQSGLALQFGNTKKISWSVGPTISLDMTRLMKEDVFTDKRYFLYTGLTGKLFFSRRKK